jgi:hypothetical protein
LVRRVRQVCLRGKVGQRSIPLLLHVSLALLLSQVSIIRCILDLRFTKEWLWTVIQGFHFTVTCRPIARQRLSIRIPANTQQ